MNPVDKQAFVNYLNDKNLIMNIDRGVIEARTSNYNIIVYCNRITLVPRPHAEGFYYVQYYDNGSVELGSRAPLKDIAMSLDAKRIYAIETIRRESGYVLKK